MTAVLERVRNVEHALAEEQTEGHRTFGLIHADLHYHNVLFSRGTARAIDFDDAGFGPLLYDPAVTLSMIFDWENYPALRAALLAGYRKARPLSEEHEALIDTFIALRIVQDALWVLEWRTYPAIKGDPATIAREVFTPVASLIGRAG